MARQKKKGLGHTLRTAADALRRKRAVAAVYVLLRFLVILTMVAQFFNGNYETVFLCMLTLVLSLLPSRPLATRPPWPRACWAPPAATSITSVMSPMATGVLPPLGSSITEPMEWTMVSFCMSSRKS